jgi:two-component system, cell cycle response regulator DivK
LWERFWRRSDLVFLPEEQKFSMTDSRLIFHVEDNFENRLLVRRLLQAYGYKVVEAENASQAKETLKSVQPDLILLDINMPDVDGYTLTSEIRAIPALARIPIVAITANVMKGDRERTLRAGCDGYIEKPIDVDRFINQVENFMK